MRCPRCLNTDPEFFYKGSRGWYCRKCISFGRMMLEEDLHPQKLNAVSDGSQEYILQYPLTPAQAKAALTCAEEIDHGDVLMNCCCGSGKTEIVVLSIAKRLKEKKKVCFAIPRRQVVLELRERLAGYFPNASVVAVCGGHTDVTDGDLIICTCHQLFRYLNCFDLLILDEPDAFPFRGSAVLHGIAKTACIGQTIYLTATPDATMKRAVSSGTMKEVKLSRRPHGHDLPVPKIVTAPVPILFLVLLRWIGTHHGPRMIFVPTIAGAHLLHAVLKRLMKCLVVTSNSPDRDEVIESFRTDPAGLIVTTTVMERGVTIPGVDICVFHADHSVFDEASLIQMAGRAGRTFQFPDGDVLFLQTGRSELTERCRRTIQEANACDA